MLIGKIVVTPNMKIPETPPTSGFISSFFTLLAIVLVLFVVWGTMMVRSRRELKLLDAERSEETTHLLDGVEYRAQNFEWDMGARAYIICEFPLLPVVRSRNRPVGSQIRRCLWRVANHLGLSVLSIATFGIDIFSIVCSALQEPYSHEPKFWLLKVGAIPIAAVRPVLLDPLTALSTVFTLTGLLLISGRLAFPTDQQSPAFIHTSSTKLYARPAFDVRCDSRSSTVHFNS